MLLGEQEAERPAGRASEIAWFGGSVRAYHAGRDCPVSDARSAPRAGVAVATVALQAAMAISGLIMVLFVLVHMYGNLKAFSGRAAFDDYAHHLRTVGEPFCLRRRTVDAAGRAGGQRGDPHRCGADAVERARTGPPGVAAGVIQDPGRGGVQLSARRSR